LTGTPEFGNKPVVKRRQIVRLAAGGQVTVRNDLFIDPVAAGIAYVCFQ
jgi:hypothetical protein